MGTSTNATVAFGFDLGDELPEKFRDTECDDDDGGFDWEDIAAAEAGVIAPDGEYSSDDPRWPKYWDAKRKAAKRSAITLITHCSGDYPCYFLAINGTEVCASRGTPEKLNPKTIDPAHLQAMKDFCEKYEIEWQEPAWHVFSYWG
jgi:hypothetical protein